MERKSGQISRQEYQSVEEIIALLRSRNMEIAYDDRVAHYLNVIGYHRLRAYCRPFYQHPSEEKIFREGVSFNDIINLYVLDRELRLFLIGPIEKIEIALRALIIEALGGFIKNNTTSTRQIELLNSSFYNLSNANNITSFKQFTQACIGSALRQRGRSEDVKHLVADVMKNEHKNVSVRSVLNPYRNLEKVEYVINNIAAWHTIHGLSFGPLSKLFSILNKDIATQISHPFNLASPTLRSIFFSLTRVRNACAHHEPIWFHRIQVTKFPRQYQNLIYPSSGQASPGKFTTQGMYITCAAIHILLSHISETTSWYARLKPIIRRFDIGMRAQMGFPKDWDELPFWRSPDASQLIVTKK